MDLQLYHVLTITAMLLSISHSVPFQCGQINSIITQCSCQAGMTDGKEDNTKVIINCRNINLSTVPPLTAASSYEIYEMTLADNQITTIPESAFDGLRIQRLNLLNNRVNSIHPRAFKGLENDLLELRMGSDKGSSLQFSVTYMVNLTKINLLHLENFRFPSNQLTEGGLNRLSTLKTLELINNSISYFSSLSVPTGLTSLTLVGQGLTSLPLDILPNLTGLQQLTITNTNIAEIGQYSFTHSPNLQFLDLSNNNIGTINSMCFTGSPGLGVTNSLKHLSLRNNPLSVMDAIRSLVALTSLDLSYTQLQALPTNATFLQNKAALVSLSLEGNNIQSLPQDTFFGLTALEELNLAHNKLATMHDYVLGGLTKLLYLDLSYQTLTNKLFLPLSTTSLTSLKILNASGTPLAQVNAWSMVSVLTSLNTLELDGTGMTTITDYAMRNLTKLTTLSLNHNQLTTLNQSMMAGPLGLRNLRLVDNSISTLDQCTFHSYAFPLDLLLASNPLKCDCGLYWLVQATQQRHIVLSGFEQCSDSSNFVNFKPNTCVGQPNPNCLELYTTTTVTPIVTTPNPYLKISLQAGITSITVRWAVNNFVVLNYKIEWLNLETTEIKQQKSLDRTVSQYTVQSLKPATGYSICLFAYSSTGLSTSTCRSVTTNSTVPAPEEGGLTSKEVGIIVGVVVGGVLLLVIISAIVYILVVVRRPQTTKDVPTYPVQPHTFTPTELPSMGASTRQFSRPASKEGSNGAAAGGPTNDSRSRPKVGRALDENIKVMVISDGHTNPQSPSRVSGGSYQFLNEKYPNPNPGLDAGAVGGAPASGATYYDMHTNSRSLPSAPMGSQHGYQNKGYRKDSDSDASHSYHQIDL